MAEQKQEVIMPLIRSMSDLRNRSDAISELCHKEDQPVFITKNGKGNLVVMSEAHYERFHGLLELYQKLSEAEVQDAAGKKGITHREMMRRLTAIVA
jgi:prevent-host-death family protein